MPSNTGEDEEFSGSDADDGFAEDMEALKRACILTGTNPNDLKTSSTTATATATATAGKGGATTDSDNDEDDIELVRKIQKRFSSSTDVEVPLFLKPLSTLPPAVSDDDEDDFETLRAIQRRFGQYNNDSLKNSTENYLHKPEQDSDMNIASEMEPSNNMFIDISNVSEGLQDCEEACNTTQNSETFNDNIHGIQPSGFIEWHQSGAHNFATSPPRYSGFPKSAQAFVDAIKSNRSCQKFLRSKLIQIEARIEENKKLKERVKILKDFQVSCRKRTGRALSQKKDARVQLISVPKQRAISKANEKKVPAMYYGPAENSHVANYRMALTKFPLSLSREKWSKEEQENLAKGIKQQFQEMLLQKSVNLFSGAEGSGDSNDFDSIIVSIRDLDITPENIRLFLPKVNWEQLASMYVTGRSGAECEARWLNCEDPLINHHPWSIMEDKNLLHIVQQKGIDNWIDIAVSLGTYRTPFQCLVRYQRSLNASILKREWTEAEDKKLRDAVETFGESNWQVVASALEGRAGTQCSNRWKKSLHPARQRVGKWTPDEDKRLKVAVMLFGPKTWKKIAKFVPGRTQVQCRERWVNCLDPSLNLDEWTEEEDSKLKAAIVEHGYCWSKVAACVPPRTDSQCRRRWKVLLPHEVPMLQAAKKIQKAALISNFVDRESERPTLGPKDFIQLPMINSVSESEYVNPSGKKKRQSRQKQESKAKDKASRDVSKIKSKRLIKETHICSEEVPVLTNCNEVENSGGDDSVSKKKRVMKPCLKKKKCTYPTKVHSSSCPDTTLLAITNGEEGGAFGGDNVTRKKKAASGRQKRESGRPESKEIDTSVDDAISKKRRVVKSHSEENKGSDPTKDHQSSCPDSNLLITNGKEVQEYGQDDATKNKKVSIHCPRENKCIGLPKEVPEMTNSDEVESFGRDDAISKKRRRETKLHSRKNKGTDPTKDHSLSCPDSTLLVIGSGKEVEAFSGNDPTKKKKAPEPHFRRKKCTELHEKIAGTVKSNEVQTFGGDDTISEKRKKLTKPHSEQDKCTDPSQYCSSSCPDSTLHRITDVDEVDASGGDGARNKKTASKLHSRSIYAKLLQEISEISDPNEVETPGENVSISKKPCLQKNKCTDPTQIHSTSFTNSSLFVTSDEEVEAFGGENAMKKKEVRKQCTERKCAEAPQVSQSLLPLPASLETRTANDDGIETSSGNNSTLCKKERAPNQHPGRIKCAKQQDYAMCSVKVAKLHSKWSKSTEIVARSQNSSLVPKCSTSNMMDKGNLSASSVCQEDRIKSLRTGDKTCPDQTSETGDGDDMTLAFFLHNKLKKRRFKLGNDGGCPSSMKGSDLLPKNIGQPHERDGILSSIQNHEIQTSSNHAVPNILPSLKMQSSHSDDLPTITAGDIDCGKAHLVNGGMLAFHESAKEPASTDPEGIYEAGDVRSSPPPGFESYKRNRCMIAYKRRQ